MASSFPTWLAGQLPAFLGLLLVRGELFSPMPGSAWRCQCWASHVRAWLAAFPPLSPCLWLLALPLGGALPMAAALTAKDSCPGV